MGREPPAPRPQLTLRRRTTRRSVLPALLAMLCLLPLVSPAAATPGTADTSSARLAQANGVSLDRAVAQVQRRTGGRVLSAETRTENGVPVHYIRVLTGNQRVRTIRVDARTGEWL